MKIFVVTKEIDSGYCVGDDDNEWQVALPEPVKAFTTEGAARRYMAKEDDVKLFELEVEVDDASPA